MRVVIVGCADNKVDGPCFASELYDSVYFNLKRSWAREFGDRWYILSAKYGLLSPKAVIESYDVTLSDDAVDQTVLAKDIATSIHMKVSITLADEIVLLAGKDYVRLFKRACRYHDMRQDKSGFFGGVQILRDVDIKTPFEETSGIGEQQKWLSETVDSGVYND